MNKLLTIIVLMIAMFIFYVTLTPSGRGMINKYGNVMHKVDDATSYNTRKVVEDTCRSMRASYNADFMAYQQYKGKTGEKESWAEMAKMRANATASSYNEYVLRNSYVWKDNIPLDISTPLVYITNTEGN